MSKSDHWKEKVRIEETSIPNSTRDRKIVGDALMSLADAAAFIEKEVET